MFTVAIIVGLVVLTLLGFWPVLVRELAGLTLLLWRALYWSVMGPYYFMCFLTGRYDDDDDDQPMYKGMQK